MSVQTRLPRSMVRLDVCILQDFPDLDAKPSADTLEGAKGQIIFASFERAVVRAMHVDLVCKPLLAKAQSFPALANGETRSFRQLSILHKDRTLSVRQL